MAVATAPSPAGLPAGYFFFARKKPHRADWWGFSYAKKRGRGLVPGLFLLPVGHLQFGPQALL